MTNLKVKSKRNKELRLLSINKRVEKVTVTKKITPNKCKILKGSIQRPTIQIL